MTMPDGCFARMLVDEGGGEPCLYRVVRPGRSRPRATVGSGDAFLAGFVAARYLKKPAEEALRLRRGLRGRVDPAPGRRPGRPGAASGGCSPTSRSTSRPPLSVEWREGSSACRPAADHPNPAATVEPPPVAGPSRPHPTLGFRHGDRDRPRQEGAPRLWVRRYRDRPVPPDPRPRRCRHLLDARSIPLRAAAARVRDGRRVSPETAGIIGKLGGLAVLNLEGILTRYEDADEQLERIAPLPKDEATREMQEIYQEPVKEELIAQRIEEIKEQGVVAAASLTPQRVARYYELALDAGLDILVIQGTVISAEHVSDAMRPPLNLKEFIARAAVPGRRGRLRQLPHGPAPHAHRRCRRARRRRPGRGLHHARRARHRRAAGHGHRRRRGGRSQHMLETGEYCRSSPTAACAPAATWRRRSPAAPTR